MRCVARRAPSEGVRRFSDRSLKRAVKAAAPADEELDMILGPREEKVMKHHSRAEMQGRLDAFSRGEYIALPARFNLPAARPSQKGPAANARQPSFERANAVDVSKLSQKLEGNHLISLPRPCKKCKPPL